MGIRFHCPNGHKLHVKSHLAGRKGMCPTCGAKLLIPQEPLPTTGTVETRGTDAPAAEAPALPPGWLVRGADGEQYGPAPDELLADWIEEGRIASDTWIWREGWPEWRQARAALADRFPELAAAPSPAPLLVPPDVEPASPTPAEPDWPAEDSDDAPTSLGEFAIDIERSDTIARLRKTHPRRRLKSNTVWAVLLLSALSVALCGLLVWILAFRG